MNTADILNGGNPRRKETDTPRWLKNEMKTMRFFKALVCYNTMRVRYNTNNPKHIPQEAWQEITSIYLPKLKDRKMAVVKTQSLLKMTQVRTVADQLLEKALTDNEITRDWLLKERKKLMEKAYDYKQLKIVESSLETFEGFVGMTAQTPLQSAQTEEINYEEIDDKAEDAKQIKENDTKQLEE